MRRPWPTGGCCTKHKQTSVDWSKKVIFLGTRKCPHDGARFLVYGEVSSGKDIRKFRTNMSLPSSMPNQPSNCLDDGDGGSELHVVTCPARLEFMNTTLRTRNLPNEGTSLNIC
jgi:hypothetical protein